MRARIECAAEIKVGSWTLSCYKNPAVNHKIHQTYMVNDDGVRFTVTWQSEHGYESDATTQELEQRLARAKVRRKRV